MERITLHVPEQLNDGTPIPEAVLDSYQRAMGEIAREAVIVSGNGEPGYSASPHQLGGWLQPSGHWTEEPMRLIWIDVEVAEVVLARVRKLAFVVKTELAQEAVYVTVAPIANASAIVEYVMA